MEHKLVIPAHMNVVCQNSISTNLHTTTKNLKFKNKCKKGFKNSNGNIIVGVGSWNLGTVPKFHLVINYDGFPYQA